MKVTMLAESSSNLSTFIVICPATAMSTDSSQVGVAFFPSLQHIFLSFYLSKFSLRYRVSQMIGILNGEG